MNFSHMCERIESDLEMAMNKISSMTITISIITGLSELERHLLVPYSTKANAFCELGRKKIGKNEPIPFIFTVYGVNHGHHVFFFFIVIHCENKRNRFILPNFLSSQFTEGICFC